MRNNRAHCLRQESLSSISDLVLQWCIRTRSTLRENCGVLCCVPLTYIRAVLKVRVRRKLIHSWHWWDVPRVLCGRSIQEMSTVVHTKLTPWSFTKKLKGLSLYSASHRMVIQSHTKSQDCNVRFSTDKGAYWCGMYSTWIWAPQRWVEISKTSVVYIIHQVFIVLLLGSFELFDSWLLWGEVRRQKLM